SSTLSSSPSLILPTMSASALISLPYTCTHTAPFLVREISPAAYDAKYASTEKEDEPTVLFAPVGEVDSVVALLINGGVWGEECPACLRKGEEGGKRVDGWVMLEAEKGEVVFDAENYDGDAVAMVEKKMGGEEDADEDGEGEVEGWWDIIDLEAEDAEAEAESGDEVMELIEVL
ncbi:MAG: hypothetical protein Q9184_006702, partial [Pyrenodesmia sp. 2 TL-2023]